VRLKIQRRAEGKAGQVDSVRDFLQIFGINALNQMAHRSNFGVTPIIVLEALLLNWLESN